MKLRPELYRLKQRRRFWPWLIPGLLITIALGITHTILMHMKILDGSGREADVVQLPLVLGCVVQYVRWIREKRSALRSGYRICPRCRYTLDPAHQPRRCPECGGSFTADELVQFWM